MRPNRVKAALARGEVVLGCEVCRMRSVEIPQIYAAAGFDFVFIDMEHSAFGIETVADMIRAARAHDITPIVRIPEAEYAFVSRVLDAGAQGIIVPRVNTAETVHQLVSWTHYPPVGTRGFACTNAQTDGQQVSAAEFIAASDRETLLVIQIERREAVANLDEMLAIDGVDVACLGYMDLTVDLGIPGQIDHPTAVRAVQKLVDVAKANNVAPGIISPDVGTLAQWIERGMRFVSHSSDGELLQSAARAAQQKVRDVIRSRSHIPAPPKN